MSSRKKAVRRITSGKRERINRLAEILYGFLPLSSRSSKATTFRSIFAESRVEGYLAENNKRLALREGFEDLFRYHERLPFTVIRKIVPAAIEWRRYKRNPLTREEVGELSECLVELGVDMRSELGKVELDQSLPPITVPPEELEDRLRNHDLVEALATEPLELFANGHFNEAVRKGTERFEDQVRGRTGLADHGVPLMGKAFGSNGILRAAGLEPENDKDFQEGMKFLTMGTMAALRNVFSHGDEERRAPEECFEMLMFLNWLFRLLDSTQ